MTGAITEAQMKFLLNLIDGADLPDIAKKELRDECPTLSKAMASKKITALKKIQKPKQRKMPKPLETDVPAGHYAVPVTDITDDGHEFKFYRVDKPTKGKWQGWTFVKQQSGDNHLRLKGDEATNALEAIATIGYLNAMQLYGSVIGKCAVCNRALTDDVSRERGVGPDCWDKITTK